MASTSYHSRGSMCITLLPQGRWSQCYTCQVHLLLSSPPNPCEIHTIVASILQMKKPCPERLLLKVREEVLKTGFRQTVCLRGSHQLYSAHTKPLPTSPIYLITYINDFIWEGVK